MVMIMITRGYEEFVDERSSYRLSFTYIKEGCWLKHISDYALESSFDTYRGLTIYRVDPEMLRGREVISFTWDVHDFYIMRYSEGLWKPIDRRSIKGLRLAYSPKYEKLFGSIWIRISSSIAEILSYEDLTGVRLSDDKTLKYLIDRDLGYWRCGMLPEDHERVSCLEEIARIVMRDWIIVMMARELDLKIIRFTGPTISYIIIDRVGRSWRLNIDMLRRIISQDIGWDKIIFDIVTYPKPWPGPMEKPSFILKIAKREIYAELIRVIKRLEKARAIIVSMFNNIESCSSRNGGDVYICGPLYPGSKARTEFLEIVTGIMSP